MKTKDLEYYRLNADENYITTPISVLRYITELETINAKLVEENERLAKEQNQSDRMHDNLVDISKNKTIQIEQLQSELSALKDEKNNFVNLEHRYQAQISEQIDRVNKWMNDAERLQSELSAAKERVKELEKNARQLCTLLAKDHILFFLSQGEKDGIMDILKTLTPKQHG